MYETPNPKMLKRRKLFTPLIIVYFYINYVKSECAIQTPCHCISATGFGYSLESLVPLGPIKTSNGSIAFQPCKNVDLTFKESTSGECQKVSLCLLNFENRSENIGTVEETHWIWPLNKIPEIIIKHKNYESHIEISCSLHDEEPILTLQSAEKNFLKFQLASTKLCQQDMRSRGLSTGSVLVILFFVFSGLYFIGGGLILIYCRGAIGRETIPNYEFWSDLPALVRDGVTFALSGCSTISYERI